MTLRYWLSGPRILNGLVRPGISFNRNDAAALFAPKAAGVSLLAVAVSPDGSVTVVRDRTPAADALDHIEGVTTPIVFVFQSTEAADTVLAGAQKRLARAAAVFAGWFHGVSAGQVAHAIKNEAAALSYGFQIARPSQGAPQPKRKWGAWGSILGFCFVLAAALFLARQFSS
jgi:hypothetical protein